MKRRILVILLALVMVLTVAACVACQETTYTLTYATGGGSGTAPAAEQLKEGAEITLKAADTFTAPEGKEFDGWLVDGTKKAAGDKITMPAKDLTITAQWKASGAQAETWTVTFKNGETVVATETVVKGQKLTASQIPSLTAPAGKVFDGWYDGETKIDENATISGNVTAIAKLVDEQSQPVITDEVNAMILHESELASGAKINGEMLLYADGTGVINIVNTNSGFAIIEDAEITYSIDSEGVFKILTVSGAKLTVPATGSVVGNTISITIENTSATGSKVQYKFESAVHKLTINYGFEIQEGVSVVEQYIPKGTTNDFTQVEREGYTLKAIKVNGEALSSLNDAKELAMPAADVQISYEWEAIPTVNYTVTYKAGEGVGDDYVVTVTSATYKLISTQIGRTKFSREGYALAGWIIDGVEKSADSTITLTGDTVIIARWNKKYTITFAGIDASGVSTNINDKWPADGTYTSSTIFYMPYAAPQIGNLAYITRPGYTLKGWTSSADNGTENEGHIYAPGENYKLSQDTIFTAIWESNSQVPVTTFNGKWVSAEGLNITSADLEIKQITIDGTSVTGDISGVLTINGNTATMTVATITYTLTLSDDVLTITAKQLNSTYTGEFAIAKQLTIEDCIGGWKGTLTAGSTTYVAVIVGEDSIILVDDGGTQSKYTESFEVDATGDNLVITCGKTTTKVTITITITSESALSIEYFKKGNPPFGTDTEAEGQFSKSSLHTVTFSLGDGVEGEAPADQQVVDGTLVFADEIYNPSRAGYTFAGWYAEGADEQYDWEAPVTADITIVAHWTAIPAYTITFSAMAPDIEAPANQEVLPGGSIEKPADLVREGYHFEGWSTSVSGKIPYDFATKPTSNLTLYAIWYKVIGTVNYNINGTVTTETDVVARPSTLFAAPEATNDNYDAFLGWKLVGYTLYTSTSDYTAGDAVNTLTLTAVYGTTYTNPTDQEQLIVRSDNTVYYLEQYCEYEADGDYLTLSSDWLYVVVYLDTENKQFQECDALMGYHFEGTKADETTVTLAFDGLGHATIDSKTVAYTVILNDYDYTVGFTINGQNIMFEEGSGGGIVINAQITIDGTDYIFGTVGGGEETTGKFSDYIGVVFGYASADAAGENTYSHSTVTFYQFTFNWNSTWSAYRAACPKTNSGTQQYTLVDGQGANGNNVASDYEGTTVWIYASSVNTKVEFSTNENGLKQVTLTNMTTNQTVTWTEIVSE